MFGGTDNYLKVEEAARQAGVSSRTIYRLVDLGELPALNWPVRIRPEDLEAVAARARTVAEAARVEGELSVQEAADSLGVARSTVQERIARGDIPSERKCGGRYGGQLVTVVQRSDLDAYVAGRRGEKKETDGEWLDTAAVARWLMIPVSTVRGLIAQGRLAAVGRPYRIHPSAVQAYVDGSRVEAGKLAWLRHQSTARQVPAPMTKSGRPDRRYRPLRPPEA